MSKKSNDYWQKREAEALKHYVTDEAEYSKQINRIYSDMLDSVQKEINAFYGKYADTEGITLAEAKKRVSQLDIAAYERKAKRYVRDASLDRKANGGKTNKSGYYFSPKANEEMRLYNATMKINRLEMLKANIGLELIVGTDKLDKFMSDILQGRTEEELKRQAGILGKSIKSNALTAHTIPNASFHNATFSERLWHYQDVMKADISKLLQTGLIQGKNARVLAKDIEKYFIGDKKLKNGRNGARYSAERLMRTELARVQTEAQRQSFQRNGYDQYEFIANSGCCPICSELNGKHFFVKDMMPGKNAPPMHCFCRCSTAAWIDEKELDEWIDFLDKGGTTEEWKQLNKINLTKTPKSNIFPAGAKSGALTTKNDPNFRKRNKFAKSYYKEVLARNRDNEIAAVAKNSGMSIEDIDKVFAHVFELKHLFKSGEIKTFVPDYDMAQSWFRLREGKNIQEHDLILLKHELMEANIMGESTTIVYETIHAEVEKTYNYMAALNKFLKENDLM